MRRLFIDQQTNDWLEWRKGGLGGSDAAAIVGVSPWQSRAQLLEHKISHFGCGKGRVSEKKKTESMIRGIKGEPAVRELFVSLTGIKIEPACVIHDIYDWFRASLDGLSEDNRVMAEIKMPSNVDHDAALGQVVPTKYYPQTQHQLGVTGLKKMFYVSWSDQKRYGTDRQLALVPVTANEDYIHYLIQKEKEFYEEICVAVYGADRSKWPDKKGPSLSR